MNILFSRFNKVVRPAIKTGFNFTLPKPQFMLNDIRGMANHRHKKMIKMAKGYRGRANRCYTVAKQRVYKALQYAYVGRKLKKRDFRKLWIQRINAASRIYGIAYNSLIFGMTKTNIILNRKVLADIAISEPLSFRAVLEVVRREIPMRAPLGKRASPCDRVLLGVGGRKGKKNGDDEEEEEEGVQECL